MKSVSCQDCGEPITKWSKGRCRKCAGRIVGRVYGRVYGRIYGRANVENGHLARIRELPQTKEAQRITGRAIGRAAVESGQLARMRELPQSKEAYRAVGRANVESGHLARINELPQTKEAQLLGRQAGGRIAGRKNVESGQLARIRELPQSKKAQRDIGQINVENGQLARAAQIALERGRNGTTQLQLELYKYLDELGIIYIKNAPRIQEGRRFTIPDASIPWLKIVFYVDGPVHDRPENHERDRYQDEMLPRLGWTVVRINWRDIEDESLVRVTISKFMGGHLV